MFKLYKNKPRIIKAVQWLPGIEVPGVTEDNGDYFVTTIQGQQVKISPGEWIIQESDDIHYYPCSNSQFQKLYEPINKNIEDILNEAKEDVKDIIKKEKEGEKISQGLMEFRMN